MEYDVSRRSFPELRPGLQVPSQPDQGEEALWFASRWQDLSWAFWEADCNVFDRGTGQIHLLNALPAEVVHRLRLRPQSVRELAGGLAEECGMTDGVVWRRKMLRVLDELESIELVERVTE